MFPKETLILLVDDASSQRTFVRHHLTALGYENVLEAGNGKEGLEVLKNQLAKNAPVGLMLVDWMMPSMSGMDLLQAIRADQELNATPFILVTSEGDQSSVIQALKAGVDAYIVKPITEAELQERLRVVWKRHNAEKAK